MEPFSSLMEGIEIHWWLLGVLAVANIPIYWIMFRAFYNDGYDFGDALGYLVQPDIISLMRGEFTEDFYQSLKIWVYFMLCVATPCAEYVVYWKFIRPMFMG